MNSRARLAVLGVAAAGLAALLLWAFAGLPAFGNYRGPYGDLINARGVPQRHVTNMATAINFDYRGFDTLGEEYILFAAVSGLAVILRRGRDEVEDEPAAAAGDRRVPPLTDAIGAFGLLLAAATNLFGYYVVVHAALTPGGGFQGGVILGTACLLVYLALGYHAFRKVSPRWLIELAEGCGAGAYAVIGVATLLAGGAMLENVLPLGTTHRLFSGGTIGIINLAVGLEVAAGFVLMFIEFLKDTRRPAEKRAA